METVLALLFFAMTLGFSIGGLIAGQKQIKLLQIYFFVIFFFILCYIGMIIGMFLPEWISVILFRFLITIVAWLFIVACFRCYHPSFGFFYPGAQITFFILFSLFFLLGIEWGLIGFRTFFTIFVTILFAISLLIGLVAQLFLKQKMWKFRFIVFSPLVLLFFVSLFKLI